MPEYPRNPLLTYYMAGTPLQVNGQGDFGIIVHSIYFMGLLTSIIKKGTEDDTLLNTLFDTFGRRLIVGEAGLEPTKL